MFETPYPQARRHIPEFNRQLRVSPYQPHPGVAAALAFYQIEVQQSTG
jgi:hypothetical protein